jgi:hypothetical protein
MATPKTYPFTISTDFPNGKVATDRLTSEIQASSISIALDNIGTAGDTCNVTFKDGLADADLETLRGLVAAHTGSALPDNTASPVTLVSGTTPISVTADGRLRIASEKTSQQRTTLYSPDWTDPTTWYQAAERMVDEVATDSGDHLTYSLAIGNVIDLWHGKVLDEDNLVDANGNSYRVAVTVNGEAKTEQDPHYGTGGDYTVDYVAGTITFLSALNADDEVLVTHHRMTASTWTVSPTAGKNLIVDFAEVQFSADVEVTDSIEFSLWGYVDVFAPQLMPGVPSGTKIPLGATLRYKSMTDFQADAVRAYPSYPPLGGNSWRGSPQAIHILDWDYVGSLTLYSAYGMEMRIRLQHDTPFGGWYATATFYCLVNNA